MGHLFFGDVRTLDELERDDARKAGWDESKHPRRPGGGPQGGEFAPRSGTGAAFARDHGRSRLAGYAQIVRMAANKYLAKGQRQWRDDKEMQRTIEDDHSAASVGACDDPGVRRRRWASFF